MRWWFPNHEIVDMETLTIVCCQMSSDPDDLISFWNLLVVDLIPVVASVLAREDQVFDFLLLVDIG